MKGLIFFLLLVGAIIVGVGFSRGWFTANPDKIQEDVQKIEKKIDRNVEKIEAGAKKDADKVVPPPAPVPVTGPGR